LKSKYYGCLVKKVENPKKYWIFKQDEKGFAIEIFEKPEEFVWDLANLGYYKFNAEILDLVKNIQISKRWEYEITDAVNLFIKNNKFELIPISWIYIDVSYPWDILKANYYFLENLKKSQLDWEIEKNVTIKWEIILEKWAVLKSGTYIEWNVFIWKNTKIWPNAYLRWNTCIWEDCKIWNAVEIKNSSIWNYTNVAHLSYIWDSIIWNNVNVGWWFISANVRHDKKNIKVMVKWKLVDTGLKKLWIIIWDNVKTGIKSYSMPWKIIENDSFIMPWEIIK
jgi:bifunctional UDP-N-acetylglucosamine pyrophosphorylase/glucosamine-1-phosphate N-acetyltransferase